MYLEWDKVMFAIYSSGTYTVIKTRIRTMNPLISGRWIDRNNVCEQILEAMTDTENLNTYLGVLSRAEASETDYYLANEKQARRY